MTPEEPAFDPPGETRMRLAELATLYEFARALLGMRNEAQIASRAVWSGIATLGVRSGAMFLHTERNRYRLAFTSLEGPATGETLALPNPAREWMLREGAFHLGASAARRLGSVHDRLTDRFDATVGIAIPDSNGLLGFMVFGPRWLGGECDPTVLDAIGSLVALALPTPAREGRPRSSRSRSMDVLRAAHPQLASMIGHSPALLEACQDVLAVAKTHFPVLLVGESGSGKELAARAIHELSNRAAGPFEVVDCGSIPAELIESELFGHVRGAFTGANRDRRGAFEMAQHGTLFLDEIGEMPLQLQTRLLRVLQEGRIRRVGDERAIDVDVRVVAATNRDLRSEVVARRFREDLFYRLNVFAIRVPPLRERTRDVAPLARHFLAAHAARLGVREWTVAPDVIVALESCPWPGNVRELANLCAALAVRGRDRREIDVPDLERAWKKQHDGEEPPWIATATAKRGHLGSWVLEQARASRFNLQDAARSLRKRSRNGHQVPLVERSALSYYLTGETLCALVESGGDAGAAAAALAGDEDLVPRVAKRVESLCQVLRSASADTASLRRRFSKLPAEYDDALAQAHRLIARR